MPSHSKNVQLYKDDAPVFSRFNIETQLDSMFHPQVTLPSGGYIVINPTEALVSIDVNSGRATKEHNIEDTALQTNLEAAEEISRQLRLRDLAGLIVIDFIDMEEKRNNRSVERKLKDCLKNDRARIQVGHISHFGLLEMSRQRMRFGVLESSTHSCPVCAGTGLVRSVSSLALMIMRAIEDHVLRKPGQSINVNMPTDVALYILNTKREILSMLESKYGLSITISAQPSLFGNQFNIEKGETRTPIAAPVQHIRADSATIEDYDESVEVEDETEEEEEAVAERETSAEQQGRGKRRRRRRGRGNGAGTAGEAANADSDSEDAETEGEEPARAQADLDDEDHPRKRRRRGRRGGRRNRRGQENGIDESSADAPGDADAMHAVEDREPAAAAEDTPATDPAPETTGEEKPKRARRARKAKAEEAPAEALTAEPETTPETEEAASEEKPKKKRAPRKKTTKAETEDATPAKETAKAEPVQGTAEDAPTEEPSRRRSRKVIPADEIIVSTPAEGDEKPKRAGWWQRRLGLG